MMRTDIRDVVRLENTRPLYSAAENLHLKFQKEHGTLHDIDERQEKLSSFCRKELEGADRQNHPYAAFLKFLKNDPLPADGKATDVQATAVDLLSLYDALDCLGSETLPQEEYPDIFEYLCNCMRRLMGSRVCYLLYSQRNHIELLSTSVFPADMFQGSSSDRQSNRPLTENDFHRIRRHVHRVRAGRAGADDRNAWNIADTVYHLQMKDPDEKDLNLITLVIDFPRYPRDQWKDEFLYIIFRQKDPVPFPDKEQDRKAWDLLITKLRNVLFLRNQILEQCAPKLYILMSSQRSYQYVKRLTAPGKPLQIMHLTDLHISEFTEKPMAQFLEHLKTLRETVDLLVITGDVIQSSNSAGIMEDRYRQAARFIRSIAAVLWSTKGDFVRTDWFKRIIIVPGNHDYATMNELQSMSLPGEPRATGLGYPARKEGGTMVKFAYYIKFLCDLLDLDITELVSNDLNEARRYLRMGLTVYGLNTVSEIGALRNNKVSLNQDAALRLVKAREPRNRFNLILSHHSPVYDPNYLQDRYGSWSIGVDIGTQNEWIREFSEILMKYAPSPGTQDQKECSGKLKKLRDTIRSELNAPDKSYELLLDISTAIQALEEHPGFNERLSLLHHTITRDTDMKKRDKDLLDQAFHELMWRIDFHMCLSGHTHELKTHDYEDPCDPEKKKKIPCVEGDRMFGSNAIHYAIMEVTMPGKVHWKGYSYSTKGGVKIQGEKSHGF